MSMDQLIRDLLVEEQFKANYTKRQRTVFCNNLREKIYAFIEAHEKDTLTRLEKHEEELHETRHKLDKLRKSYAMLYKETDTYVCVTLVYTLICLGMFGYIYYKFILYPYLSQ